MSSTLGEKTSTSGSTRRRNAAQSYRAAGEAGSSTARSSDVVTPAARARANSAASAAPPFAAMAGSSDGYPTCSRSTVDSSTSVPSQSAFAPTWCQKDRSTPGGSSTSE